jgi:hypothetical protein
MKEWDTQTQTLCSAISQPNEGWLRHSQFMLLRRDPLLATTTTAPPPPLSYGNGKVAFHILRHTYFVCNYNAICLSSVQDYIERGHPDLLLRWAQQYLRPALPERRGSKNVHTPSGRLLKQIHPPACPPVTADKMLNGFS